MLTLNASTVLNEILEVKKVFLSESNTNQQNTISGRFKSLKVVIAALAKLKKDLRSLEYSYPQMDLNSKMEYYAELSYMAENSRNEMKSYLLVKSVSSLSDRLFKYYTKKYIKILNKAEQKFFKLTYPENKSLDDPEYVAQLDKDYATALKFAN